MGISVISNPPYNMKWDIPPFASVQSRFNSCDVPPKSNANFAFILTALDLIDDKAVFLLPCGALNSDLKEEINIRKFLVDKNYIDSVVVLPDKMFESTSIGTCLLVLNKSKTDTKVSMIDMRKQYIEEQREQNGQFGSKAHTGRTYVKTVKSFSNENIDLVLKIIENREDIEEISKTVTIKEIADGKYNLNAARYIDFVFKEPIHREYKDIAEDLNRTIREKNMLKLTLNESIAKSLGMHEFGLMQKQAKENAKSMSEFMEQICGVKIEQDNYISLTKNKGEIRFENADKEKLSTIFISILQMYKQHIMYLNEEENRYLIELRDAILPDLMSGKIGLQEKRNDNG